MIGLLGGTFDPVHYGHLRIALEAKEMLDLAEVRFIPCRQPPHRGEPGATAAQRLAMLQLAIADMPGFRLDSRELERAGPSYMVDTLAALRAELADTPLCLLLGQDAFSGLPNWHRWLALLDYAHIVVVQRPAAEAVDYPSALKQLIAAHHCDAAQLSATQSGGIAFLETTLLDISASRIRALLAAQRSPRYLLPKTVLEFIRQTGLYLC